MDTETIIKVVTTADAGLLEALNGQGQIVMHIAQEDAETISDGVIRDIGRSFSTGADLWYPITTDVAAITRTYFGLDVNGLVVTS